MVIYVKFNREDEPVQFTTALEAKEHIRNHEGQVNSVLILRAEEALDDLEDASFEEFESTEDALASFGEEEAHPEAVEDEDESDDAEEFEGEESEEESSEDAEDDDVPEEEDHSEESEA